MKRTRFCRAGRRIAARGGDRALRGLRRRRSAGAGTGIGRKLGGIPGANDTLPGSSPKPRERRQPPCRSPRRRRRRAPPGPALRERQPAPPPLPRRRRARRPPSRPPRRSRGNSGAFGCPITRWRSCWGAMDAAGARAALDTLMDNCRSYGMECGDPPVRPTRRLL